MSERRTHPGWTDRYRLSPESVATQGEPYIEACTLLLRDSMLRRWANDERNAAWHPAPEMRFRLEIDGTYGDGHTTWLVGQMDAVYRPPGAPEEVLDHVHSAECEHDTGPHGIIPGVMECDYCGEYYFNWRKCPERCPSTQYAAYRLREPYEPPAAAS